MFAVLFPHLDERQRRLLMGAEARTLGHGGILLVARAARVREATVALGVTELDSDLLGKAFVVSSLHARRSHRGREQQVASNAR
jgi:hypothetical protein